MRFESGRLGPRKFHHSVPIPVEGVHITPALDAVQGTPLLYELRAVVLQDGELAGEHYWTAVRKGLLWYMVDDAVAMPVGPSLPGGAGAPGLLALTATLCVMIGAFA
ncbi:MAG: hypothetical protein ACKPKO_05375, partial [Candidatus Fonsibacter sp.]